ncbi:MAG: hypothetical protein JNM95_15285 [Chitinophagaceae bacterium]|nr:hypothetical protein [Chitinophagaceae bacterium]
MKRLAQVIILVIFMSVSIPETHAQCVMCKKTASSLDDEGAKGLNNGIIYLAFTPLILIGFIGFKWYQRNKHSV